MLDVKPVHLKLLKIHFIRIFLEYTREHQCEFHSVPKPSEISLVKRYFLPTSVKQHKK